MLRSATLVGTRLRNTLLAAGLQVLDELFSWQR
jgi:hypothetical protein